MKEAFKFGIISDGDTFLGMLNDRNLMVHIYDEKVANDVAWHTKDYYIKAFSDLIKTLESLIK